MATILTIKDIAKAIAEIQLTMEGLHTDILNLASTQETIFNRLNALEFERNYYKESCGYLTDQLERASKFVPANQSSCLIPPPPMPSNGAPHLPSTLMREHLSIWVPKQLVGLILGRKFRLAKSICKSVRESMVARAWYPDVWCRLEAGESKHTKTELIIKAKYWGVAELVAAQVRARVARASKLMVVSDVDAPLIEDALVGLDANDVENSTTSEPSAPWTQVPLTTTAAK